MSSTATDERRPLRLARGAVVGLVGGALAVAGHALGGGSVPGPAAWPALLVVVAGSVLASGRRWTPGRLVVALAGAQALVHAALWLASPSSPVDPRLAAAASGHASDHASHGAASDLRMLAAHAAATLVAVVLLAALERCALAVWSALHLVRFAASRQPLLARPRVVARGPVAVAPTALVVVGRRPRRGPPALPAPC